MSRNTLNTLKDFNISDSKKGKLYSLPALEKSLGINVSRLPVSIRIVLESVLRNCDGKKVTEEHVKQLASWGPTAERTDEIPFVVARASPSSSRHSIGCIKKLTGMAVFDSVCRSTPLISHRYCARFCGLFRVW